MKQLYRKIMPYILACEILISSLFSCSITVYASDFMPRDIIQAVEYGIEHNDWDPFWRFLNETKDGLAYLFSQMGAIITANFQQWVDNNKALESLAEKVPVPARKEENNIVFTKEFMTQLKALLDEYAKENEPYFIVPVASYRDVNPAQFATKGQYNTICNLAKEYGLISVNGTTIADLSGVAEEGYSFVSASGSDPLLDKEIWAYMYDNGWQQIALRYRRFTYEAGMVDGYTSMDDGDDPAGSYMPNHDRFSPNYALCHNGSLRNYIGTISEVRKASLVSRDGGRIRVYRTLDDFKRYSVGSRNVYFTENYYNYVPGDLSVSIDDLQKTVDDLKDVLDQLLGQITDNTSEKEIEELLKQILEALKNQGGSSGGDGPGDGDVNVDIDLSSTNTLLSKMLAKVTQIFDKISASAGQTMTDVVESISNLGEMLKKYLTTITGDLDDIKGKLEQMTEEEFSEKTDSFLNETTDSFSEIAEVAKGKFPFSIPNDMRTLLEKLSLPPPSPETAALYSTGMAGAVPYSGDHGGGGASRPPGDISSIEQGNGGGSFGISESGAPVIRCPIVLERLGIDYAIKIDLSEFDKVAALSRALLTFIYIYGLYNLTFKVMGLWGDLTE